jgi:hypothetical protein
MSRNKLTTLLNHTFFAIFIGVRYNMPNAYTFLDSMHSTNGRPARIAHGSWRTSFRKYPFSCKFFDEALNGKYQGDLFITSPRTEGTDEETISSKANAISDPTSCKNTLVGTSSSGPVAAGNAALVRQYFEEGKLPCKRTNGCTIDPSGSLVKAVLLNSAQSFEKLQVTKPLLEKRNVQGTFSVHDSNQGMGLVQLDNTLPISGHNKLNAIVRNNKTINDGEFHDIFIKATPNTCLKEPYKHDFSATLTWYDPAGAVSCTKCLMNDLDIMVNMITPDGKVKRNSKVFPNGGTQKDSENNVEHIHFEMTKSRRYRIRIQAANLATAQQNFSLIATGCFKVISNPSS